ncbi:hypothetical protein UFOVP600_22 [uncultured Caudovirales phage]|uniref:VRR-NUC domain containing protein n=1 Tax=uncultured Caudovirales phage TaxID=2100421 RepID=A0A6J5N0C9_9CAUD|nr:hypothetical protein UFOVP600_22 [uncultured Caudovirales phage]
MKLESIKKMSESKIKALSNKSEFTIQVEIVDYCRKNNIICFSIPNEATRNNSKYIKSGVLAGVSDLIVLKNGKAYFVELKDYKGRQSDKQKKFENMVTLEDFKYFLVRSLDEFKKIIIFATQN